MREVNRNVWTKKLYVWTKHRRQKFATWVGKIKSKYEGNCLLPLQIARVGKDRSNKLMIFESNRKKVEFCPSAEKGHVWKESGVTTQGRKELDIGVLLLSNDKNVIAKTVLSYFYHLSCKFKV